jgi:proton glutamate symport protein
VVCSIFHIPYLQLLRKIGDLIFLSFVTRSSEVVLAPLIKRLDDFGVDPKISSFTMPLGYSFNADGATMYEGLAVVFLAHAYGIELSVPRLLSIMLVLMVLTKGIAGVPSSSIVVLFAASAAVGLPAEGVAVLLAIDFVVDMARTALNVGGNSVATCVVARSEGRFQRPRPATGGRPDPAPAEAAASPGPTANTAMTMPAAGHSEPAALGGQPDRLRPGGSTGLADRR